MKRALVVGVLAAAVAGINFGPGTGRSFLSRAVAADAAPQPAGDKADKAEKNAKQADVPVRQVVLFSSGVGYFEHFGTVSGNGAAELSFKTQQINDILKSLVLQDLDKGRITTITYPSQDPVAKTLRSFQVDITSNPALHDLLEQLRGAQVTISLGGENANGTILGVEKKQRPVGDKDKGQVVDAWYVNLLTGGTIRQVPLDDVRDVQLQDPKLREELTKALAALAAARDQDKKPVQIHFEGRGDRRVRIGYVVETPVWKTSYRLLVDGPAVGAAKDGDEGKPADAGKKAGDPDVFEARNAPATQPAGGGRTAGGTGPG